MSFEPVTIEIGGHSWTLPRLPWRVTKFVQPVLLQLAGKLESAATIGAADLESLTQAVHAAVQGASSGPKISRAEFDELPTSLVELIRALRPIAAACGMEPAAEPASPKAESPSTSTS